MEPWLIFKFTFGAIMSVTLAIMIALAMHGRRSEHKWLLKNGALAEAEIISCQHRHRIDELRGMTVTYRFTPHGQTESVTVSREFSKIVEIPVGSKVAVRYHPKFPYISSLVPYVDLHSASG